MPKFNSGNESCLTSSVPTDFTEAKFPVKSTAPTEKDGKLDGYDNFDIVGITLGASEGGDVSDVVG